MGEAQTYTIPVPTRGINLVDPIDMMEPWYALELNNLVPAGISLYLRGGYTSYSTTGASTGATLALRAINNADGTSDLISQANGFLWDTGTPVAVALNAVAYSDTPFNSDTFAHRGYFANGVDNLQVVNAGAVADSTFTGIALDSLINVSTYKERLYFIEKTSLKVWYGNTQAVGASALTSFDFQFAMKDGGYLVMCGSWTNNTADTSRDLFFALSSEGEILFYQGSSPADTTTPWGLVARYKIGKPLGYRACVEVENDRWILTNQGLVSIASLFSSSILEAFKGIGDKINPYLSQQAALFSFSSLWGGTFWSKGRRVYITVPTSGANTKTLIYHMDGGWAPYTFGANEDALVTETMGQNIYYGSPMATVFLGENGTTDNGAAINYDARFAFNFFGTRGNFKTFKDCRPLMRTSPSTSLQIGIDTDFKRSAELATISPGSSTYTAWGSLWGSAWSTGTSYLYNRYNLPGTGHSGALRIKGSVLSSTLEFYAFEVGFETGSRV